jgi:hypothetical protein
MLEENSREREDFLRSLYDLKTKGGGELEQRKGFGEGDGEG